jgi:hypothetical protein
VNPGGLRAQEPRLAGVFAPPIDRLLCSVDEQDTTQPFAQPTLIQSTEPLPSELLKSETAFNTAQRHEAPYAGLALHSAEGCTRNRWTCRIFPAAFAAFGGAGRDRTDGLLLAKQALSQLSYGPALDGRRLPVTRPLLPDVVGLDGFEPSTPALSRRCSNQLSYRPLIRLRCARCATDRRGYWNEDRSEKGGDPAAPSDTATLLRLHPSHEAYRGRRPPCG